MKNTLGTGLRTDFHFGRWTSDFGRRRLIARSNFRNASTAFDGFHWQIGREKLWRLRAFVAEPVIRREVQLDEQNSKSLFWGTYFESHHFHWFQMDAYYLGLNDKLSANVANRRTYSTFGGRLCKEPKPGEPDYEFETVWQTGTKGVTDHFAYLQHLDLGYTFNLPWKPRVVFHYDYASGTRTPGGSQDGSFDTLFGARNFEYTRTGIWGPFSRSNLQSPGWRVIVEPASGWILEIKHRAWFLAQSTDFFGSSGLRDPTGQAGTSLGQDVELRTQREVSSNLDFDFGYAHWFKGSYFDNPAILAQMPTGGNKDGDYFFAAMRIRI